MLRLSDAGVTLRNTGIKLFDIIKDDIYIYIFFTFFFSLNWILYELWGFDSARGHFVIVEILKLCLEKTWNPLYKCIQTYLGGSFFNYYRLCTDFKAVYIH